MLDINTFMDDLEQETQVMMVDGEAKTVKEILDSILQKDEPEQKQFSEG